MCLKKSRRASPGAAGRCRLEHRTPQGQLQRLVLDMLFGRKWRAKDRRPMIRPSCC